MAGLRWEMKHMEYPSKGCCSSNGNQKLRNQSQSIIATWICILNQTNKENLWKTYDPKELEMGMSVEKEHTQDEALAKKIAMDHLQKTQSIIANSRLLVLKNATAIWVLLRLL
jgi:hypothetical protein